MTDFLLHPTVVEALVKALIAIEVGWDTVDVVSEDFRAMYERDAHKVLTAMGPPLAALLEEWARELYSTDNADYKTEMMNRGRYAAHTAIARLLRGETP